jgi:hypothetical protein
LFITIHTVAETMQRTAKIIIHFKLSFIYYQSSLLALTNILSLLKINVNIYDYVYDYN